jgi:hypothetical protein
MKVNYWVDYSTRGINSKNKIKQLIFKEILEIIKIKTNIFVEDMCYERNV